MTGRIIDTLDVTVATYTGFELLGWELTEDMGLRKGDAEVGGALFVFEQARNLGKQFAPGIL